MRVAEEQGEASLSSLRIRLEGAYEVVDAAASRYEALEKLLASNKWRRALRQQPDVLDEAVRLEGSIREARARVERVAESDEANGPLPVLLAKLSASRAALHQTALRRLRAKTALPLEDALAQLSSRVLAEIPGSLRPGEKRLLEGGGYMQGWTVALILMWISMISAGPLIDFLDPGSEGKSMGALLAVLLIATVFWAPFLIAWAFAGKYTLTNQRLIWTPRRGEPVQVDLATLKPGAFSISPLLGWIKVDALEPFTMRAVENANQVAAYAEMLRWMSSRPTAGVDPLTNVAIFPAFEGEVGYDGGQETQPDVIAVMRPTWAAYFKKAKGSAALKVLTGNSPGESVDFEAALKFLKQLGADEFDNAVREAAQKEGVLMERPPAIIASTGPVWQHLIVRTPTHAFAVKVTWRHLAEVEPMVGIWRQR